MPLPPITYRGPTSYAADLGRNLTPHEFDDNVFNHQQRIEALEADESAGDGGGRFPLEQLIDVHIPSSGAEIGDTIIWDGLQWVNAPRGVWRFRGPWKPHTVYARYDAITANGNFYEVIVPHTSGASFNPNANDGMGNDFYGLIIALDIKVEGLADVFIGSPGAGNGDLLTYDAALHGWIAAPPHGVSVEMLTDVLIGSPGAENGDVLTYNSSIHKWIAALPHVSVEMLTDVVFATSGPDDGDLLIFDGATSKWVNLDQSALSISYTQLNDHATPAQNRQPAVTALGTTGAVSLDPSLGDVFSITPTGNVTLNADSADPGACITLIVTTSGTSSFNITFGTNFKSTGVLATGTASGKVFTVSFVGDGANLNQTSRTTAM